VGMGFASGFGWSKFCFEVVLKLGRRRRGRGDEAGMGRTNQRWGVDEAAAAGPGPRLVAWKTWLVAMAFHYSLMMTDLHRSFD
jgi:hypothetical protein